MRFVAIGLLAVVAVRHLVFAGWLYFIAPMERLAGSLAGLFLALAGVAYLLLLRGVVKRSRPVQLLAIVVCLAAAGLGLLTIAGWSDSLIPAANLAAAVALAWCLPPRRIG